MAARLVSVQEAAQLLGVTRQRVLQRIAEGSLRAEKVGSRWVIDATALSPARTSRPLSPRMVWALARALEGRHVEVRSDEVRRVSERLERLDGSDPRAVAALVRSWLSDRARRLELEVHPEDLDELRKDPRLNLSGVSDPRAGLSSGRDLEAYIEQGQLDGLAEDYFLDLNAKPEHPNVVLHVSPVAMDGVPRLFSAADLLERGGPRETRAALALIGRAA